MARKLIKIDTTLVKYSNDPGFIKVCQLLDSEYERYLVEAKEILQGKTLIKEIQGFQVKFFKRRNQACYEIANLKESKDVISSAEIRLNLLPSKKNLDTIIQSLAQGEAAALTYK